MASFASAATGTGMYAWSECLREGIAFSVRRRGTSAQEPQQGADVTETDADCTRHPSRAIRPGHHVPGRMQRQAASIVMEPNKSWGSANRQTRSTTSTSEHPFKACSPDLSLIFKQSCPASMRVVRLQLRCNPDSHKDDAYTSFGRQGK